MLQKSLRIFFIMCAKSIHPSDSPLTKPFKSPMLTDKTKSFTSPFKKPKVNRRTNISQKEKELLQEKEKLDAEIKQLKTRLSKLERIKLYKEKVNSPEFGDLKLLTSKWRSASQEIIPILVSKFRIRDPEITTTQLLAAWNIPHSLVRYDEENQDFY